MFHDLTKAQKRALRAAAELAHDRDRTMEREDRDVHYLEARNSDLPIIIGGAIAKGILTLEEVGEPARELVADVAARIRAVWHEAETRAAEAADDGEDEADGYDAGAPVSVTAIVREIDGLRDETTLYVNRRTGEVRVMEHVYLPDEDDDEFDEFLEGEPGWEADAKAEGCAMVSNPDWIALFERYDISDRDIMIRFARNARPAASRDLLDALHQRGAYRRFREEIHRRGLQKEWDAFREERLADSVRFELREKGIPFRR